MPADSSPRRSLATRRNSPVVLALPRGGVPVAAEVAAALDAPLDLILVRKIGVPFQPELAMGAVVDGREPVIVRNEDVISLTGVSEQEFNATRDQQLAEIERRRKLYLGDRPHPQIADRIVIVVDDGIATGATTRAALQAIRMRKPSKLVLAVPVAPTDTLEEVARRSRRHRLPGRLRTVWRNRAFLLRFQAGFGHGSYRDTGSASC